MRYLCLVSVLVACGGVDHSGDDVAPIDAPLACTAEETVCGNQCVNTDNDPEHCGSCAPCAFENATTGCVQGTCVLAECAAGFCDLDGIGGCEAQPDFQNDAMNCGGCGHVCGVGSCSAGGCSHRVFITTNTYPADLGGLDGADSKCQVEAIGNGLSGTYRAWLADDTGSPSTRFITAGSFVRAASPNVVIANDFADLSDGTLDNSVLLLANGVTPPAGFCWTNVAVGGVSGGGAHCNNWTSTSSGLSGSRGQHNLTSLSWTAGGSQNCDPNLVPAARLYCVEQ